EEDKQTERARYDQRRPVKLDLQFFAALVAQATRSMRFGHPIVMLQCASRAGVDDPGPAKHQSKKYRPFPPGDAESGKERARSRRQRQQEATGERAGDRNPADPDDETPSPECATQRPHNTKERLHHTSPEFQGARPPYKIVFLVWRAET